MQFISYLVVTSILLGCPVMGEGQSLKIESRYDPLKDETTVKHSPIKLGGENGQYHSLHSVVSYKYSGKTKRIPDFLTFELITVVKDRKLNPDLYVQLLVDGDKIFLPSNRWAEKDPVPGKPWISEHIALRMPYEVFTMVTQGRNVVIQMDAISFSVGKSELKRLREFGEFIIAG